MFLLSLLPSKAVFVIPVFFFPFYVVSPTNHSFFISFTSIFAQLTLPSKIYTLHDEEIVYKFHFSCGIV